MLVLIYFYFLNTFCVSFTGENLVNGVQCVFEVTSRTDLTVQSMYVKSPVFSSDNDSPVAHTLDLTADDRVVSISTRTGALVDSIEILTSKGLSLRAGGSGGGDVFKIELAVDETLVGFYGGK